MIENFKSWYENSTGDRVSPKDKENLEKFEKAFNENPQITTGEFFHDNPMTFGEAVLVYEFWQWLKENK